MSSREAGGSLLFLLKTVETVTSVERSRIPYFTSIVLGKKTSDWPNLGSLFFRDVPNSVHTISEFSRLRFYLPCAGSGSSSWALLSFPSLRTAATHLELFPRLLSRLCLFREVADGSLRLRRAGSIDTLFPSGESGLQLLQEGFRLFFLAVLPLLAGARTVQNQRETDTECDLLHKRALFRSCMKGR